MYINYPLQDAAGPSLDFYVSDSMQDMLDVDIWAEIASTLATSSDLTSLDHALETISAIKNNTSSGSNLPVAYNANANFLASSTLHASPTAKWMGSSANFWSNTDYYADLGPCVNPFSVMPLINSAACSASSMLGSPRRGTAATSTQSRAVPASPCGDRDQHKSHLTFSPAQMKVSAGSLRREQVRAHIPKQISVVTGTGSTAPATMATNSVLQRRNSSAVDAVRKDLGTELRRAQSQSSPSEEGGNKTSKTSSNQLTTGGVSTNTIKLAPGIGGLTFANSAAYQKLKHQSSAKSPNGSSPSSGNGMVLKREEASKRSLLQQGSTTPKSIASAAHSPHHQMQSMGSPSSGSSLASSSPLSNGSNLVNIANNSSGSAGLVKPLQQKVKLPVVGSAFPKPAYSYSCLIALALKNSRAGSLPVSEIYSFLCQHFQYFENAPSGWKNSVRHNLWLNKCFEKIERNQRKGCRWAMNPERITKMDEEVQKWSRKDPQAIRCAMLYPEHLESLERGEMKHGSADSDVELDSTSEIEESSDLEEQDFDDTLVDAMLVEEDEDVVDEDEDDDMLGEFEPEEELLASHSAASQSSHHLPLDHVLLRQKSSDFDIEVDEQLYDAIDIEDDKEAVRRAIASGQGTHIIELNPADLNANHNGYHHQQQQQAKRARLDINYAIGPAGELEQQYGQKVKVQQLVQTQAQPQPTTYNRRKMPLVNRII
ncbi:uncharacterized protein LOC117187111 [Drosophila miranda]|uniref:uncharacterized protein LOC117187111 n=1 Tax=Drosophila miranda TaxID=7229 RepID=UPI00143F6836|nr:uncharacterized protein LOC117187111 [Drosophila miranda]